MIKSAKQQSPDSADTLEQAIDQRIETFESWLRDNAPDAPAAQRHLVNASPERAYWHYGYLMALHDLRAWLRERAKS
ncbi:MAG: hypothetical protein ACREPT_13115 [Rudaea sp.]